jgi:DNA primase
MSDVEEIKSRLNIVDLVSEYINLKKAGSSHKALCPFHSEKSPSFMVNEARQIFHCFGCGKGGDIFTFVQEIEGLEFREALTMLAEKTGVELEPGYSGKRGYPGSEGSGSDRDEGGRGNGFDSNNNLSSSELKKRLKAIMKLSLDFYSKCLSSKIGDKAKKYLAERGVKEQTIEAFDLGYAPEAWDSLLKVLLKRGYKEREVLKTGLIVESQKKPGSYYDRFRNRLMFPVFDIFSGVVGYSARVLPGDDTKMGKYINTPQTALYDKSKVIYGLNLAKQAIKKESLAIMLEGNLDVILSHQAGVKNIVATSGTAVTEEQIKILSRYAEEIAFAFDSDSAGIEASKKGMEIALNQGVNVSAIDLSNYDKKAKDVADLVLKDEKIWQKAAGESIPAMDYFLEISKNNLDLNKIKDKKKFIEEQIERIAQFKNKVDQAYYLEQLADLVGMKAEILYDMLDGAITKLKQEEQKAKFRLINRNNYNNSDSNIDQKVTEKSINGSLSKFEKILNRLTLLLIFFPQTSNKAVNAKIKILIEGVEEIKDLKNFLIKDILEVILENEINFNDPNKYLEILETDEQKVKLARLITIGEKHFEKPDNKYSPKDDLIFCLKKIKELTDKDKKANLLQEIKKAEQAEDNEKLKSLMEEYNRVLKQN